MTPDRHQRGMSLVGILVGLLLSSLAALATLSLYRTLVARSSESRQRASQDGNLASGTLAAQMELQGAGFGVGTASTPAVANTDLIVLANASLSGAQLGGTAQPFASTGISAGNAIVWGTNPTLSTYECAALLAVAGGLQLLRANCSVATEWASVSWQKTLEVVPAGTVTSNDPPIRAEHLACWPYGQGTASTEAMRVTLWSDSSSWRSTICLPNVMGPST